MNVKTCCFIFVLILAALAPVVGQDRIELGWQTTRRGIVWYQSGKPTHQPTYRLSRDTNAVLWVDTLTALRYDWDYKTDRWRAKGTTKSALPPLPQQTSGSALIDNTTAFWIRDTFNVLHKYDSTVQAWTPMGDFFHLSTAPTNIAATGSNGAAQYTRSLWQDSDDNLVRYWDGDSWELIAGADTDLQKVDTFDIVSNTLRLSLERDAEPFKSVNLAPYLDNTDDQKADTFQIVSNVLRLSLESDAEPFKSVDLSPYVNVGTDLSYTGTSSPVTLNSSTGNDVTHTAGTGISLAATSGNMTITNTAPDQTVTINQGGIVTVSGTYPTFTVSATEVDGSTSNELQTLNNTGDATSHTATLSNSGGSLKLKEGSNITLTTDATGLNGEVTISATAPASDGNGIYGDGTAGTGDDALPPGGSTVTIPGQWQPLVFAMNAGPDTTPTAIRVTTDYCSDEVISKYLVGRSPSDSLEIYNFDCSGWIKETGGVLNLQTDRELYVFSDSINLSTVPARTIGAAMLAMDGTGFVRKISGSSSGQILQWNGSNWALAAAPSGGITGAENGLTTVGSNVRLGGTLITTTIIGQAGFDLRTYGGKYGHSQYTGFSYSPTQTFGVSGYEGNPTTGSSPTADGIAEFAANTSGGVDQPNSLTIGALTTDNNGMWMQARSRAVPNFYYPLLMQPNGGRFAVGRSGTTASHFTVTASGLTGSTASGMVGLFENSGGSGNVSVGFGAGSDAVSGQLMWNGTNDVMRIINRNGVSGTSKISFAIGGETSDRAHLIYSSTAPNALFSVGQTAANTHSTVQSGGSFATAFRSVTAGTTLTVADRTVVYTLNSTVTFTLPSAVGIAGREYIIHHFGSGGNISLSSSVISSTGTTFSAVGARQWAYIISDGTNWQGYLLTSL